MEYQKAGALRGKGHLASASFTVGDKERHNNDNNDTNNDKHTNNIDTVASTTYNDTNNNNNNIETIMIPHNI